MRPGSDVSAVSPHSCWPAADDPPADTAPPQDPAPQITLCHATGPAGWTIITISANGVLSAHAHHVDDIIPPFAYVDRGESISYGGANLGPVLPDGTTGQEILDAGCETPDTTTTVPAPAPTRPPAPTPPPTPPSTTDPGSGTTTNAPTTTTPSGPIRPPIEPICDEGEIAWNGRCFAIPDVLLPTAPTVPPPIAPATGQLVPTVDCVDSDGATNVAWFGYVLDGDAAVTVPRGPTTCSRRPASHRRCSDPADTPTS